MTNEEWYALQNKLTKLKSNTIVDCYVDGTKTYTSDLTLEIPENVRLYNAHIVYTGNTVAVQGEVDPSTCTIQCTNPRAIRVNSWFAKFLTDWYSKKLPAKIEPSKKRESN